MGSCISKSVALAEEPNPRPFDADFRLRMREQESIRRRSAREADAESRKAEYASYLLTSSWRARRFKVLERAKYLCEGCGEHPAMEVHHVTYDHVGGEFLWELRAVCVTCHERLHQEKDNSWPSSATVRWDR